MPPVNRRDFFVTVGAAGAGISVAASAPQPWTSVRAWSGQAFPIDHALSSQA